MPDNKEKILEVIRRIPKGRVATYGQIAMLAGLPNNARQVGTVLRQLGDESDVPWFRVVNACGKISRRDSPAFEGLQRHELENEGIVFDDRDRLNLNVYRWSPESTTSL